tara:strand:- start:323 stop:844 length:522 start_codon:yes stop_codon:yes gene_type:complete
MKTYTVQWHKKRGGHAYEVKLVDGVDPEDAVRKATNKWHFDEYPIICAFTGWGYLVGINMHWFLNPDFVEDKKRGSNPSKSRFAESHKSPQLTLTSNGLPQRSIWSTLYRVCGGLILFSGLFATLDISSKDEAAAFEFAITTIVVALTSFLFAFLIDVLTDIREYLKKIANNQ